MTVLVSPSNLIRMISIYQNHTGLAAGGPRVEPLLLQQRYLNVERLMTLMAISSTEGQIPLYIQVILRILRKMAREPNLKPGIDYRDFKRRILAKDLTQHNLGLSASDLICLKVLLPLQWRTPNGMTGEMIGLPLPESSLLLILAVRSWMLIQHVRCLIYVWECFSSRRWTRGELSPLIRCTR